MVRKLKGPKGQYYAVVDDIRLHSPYDPRREADRFTAAAITSQPSTILVLGPGLGYIIDSCKKYFPGSTILAVFYHADFFRLHSSDSVFSYLYDNPAGLSEFIRRCLHELDLEGLTIIEWPASGRCFPDVSRAVHAAVRDVVQELHANFITTDSFGKKMMINSIKNFIFHSDVIDLHKINRPVFIAASGPGLEKALPFIRRFRRKAVLFALPSSLEALSYYELQPDAVVMTDPGFYSRFHTFSLTRNFPADLPIIKSFSSSFTTDAASHPTMFIGWDLPFEARFVAHYYGPGNSIPENGTVAGTALELCLLLSSPAVFFAGLDFSYDDLLSHVLPHPFFDILLEASNKTSPFMSLLFSRKRSFEDSSNSFSSFRNWFSNKLSGKKFFVNRLFPSTVPIDGMPEADGPYIENAFSGYSETLKPLPWKKKEYESADRRISLVSGLIDTITEGIRGLQKSDTSPSFSSFARENGELFSLLYTFDPIGLKLYKKNSRGENGRRPEAFDTLLQEAYIFFTGIKKWLSRL
jgi:hypothetical protein